MQYISTKQLRLLFPQIRASLARGEEYVLIHRSRPIAKLVPWTDSESDSESSESPETSAPPAPTDDHATDLHITSHILHKPLTLPVPVGYSHPIAFRHLKLDLKEVVNLTRPPKAL